MNDRRLKLKELAAESGLSKSTVHRIIIMDLGMNKISARWIPKLLSAVEKARRVECAESVLERSGENPDPIFERIVTGDETMVLYFDPATKKDRWSGGVLRILGL